MPKLKIVTRSTAMKKGLHRYYTGVECLRGHLALRATSTGTCQQCHKDDRKGKYRDRVQRYQREYHKRRRAEFAAVRDARP